jgi:hypothetical protein
MDSDGQSVFYLLCLGLTGDGDGSVDRLSSAAYDPYLPAGLVHEVARVRFPNRFQRSADLHGTVRRRRSESLSYLLGSPRSR